jgi:hypothetical protein
VSPRLPETPADGLPVAAPPRRNSRNEVDLSRAAPELEGAKERWTMEARVALGALVVTLLAMGLGGAFWVGGIARDVAGLQQYRESHATEGEQRKREVDARFLVDEAAMRDVKATSETNFAVIKEQLAEINSKLDDLKQNHH